MNTQKQKARRAEGILPLPDGLAHVLIVHSAGNEWRYSTSPLRVSPKYPRSLPILITARNMLMAGNGSPTFVDSIVERIVSLSNAANTLSSIVPGSPSIMSCLWISPQYDQRGYEVVCRFGLGQSSPRGLWHMIVPFSFAVIKRDAPIRKSALV